MEKIKLYFDWSKHKRLSDKATDLAKYANSVAIPLLKAMDVPVTWENVLSTCRHPEHPRYYLELQLRGTKYEIAALKEQIAKEFERVFAAFKQSAKRQNVAGEHISCCHLNGEIVEVNKEKLEDISTVWLTDPKEIAARREHEQLCKALEDFCRRAGVWPWQFDSLFQVDVNKEEILPNPFINPYPEIAANTKE